MRFQHAWGELIARLATSQEIPNWSRDSGLLGEPFRAVAASKAVVIDAPGARGLQTVGMDEFREVFDLWPGYLAGAVPRRQVRDTTRFSKYIISLFHWLEEELGASLSS